MERHLLNSGPMGHFKAHWSMAPILATLALEPEVENYLLNILPKKTQDLGPLKMFGAEDISFYHEHLIPNGLMVLEWGLICIGEFEEMMLLVADVKSGELYGVNLEDLGSIGIIWRDSSRQQFGAWTKENFLKACLQLDAQSFDKNLLTLLYGIKHGMEDLNV